MPALKSLHCTKFCGSRNRKFDDSCYDKDIIEYRLTNCIFEEEFNLEYNKSINRHTYFSINRMKLIDNYFYMILKFLKRKKNTNFTELISVIKNKSTLSSKLKQLLAENIIIKKNGTYKLSEKGKKILNLLNEI